MRAPYRPTGKPVGRPRKTDARRHRLRVTVNDAELATLERLQAAVGARSLNALLLSVVTICGDLPSLLIGVDSTLVRAAKIPRAPRPIGSKPRTNPSRPNPVAAARVERAWSQRELAKRSGASVSTIVHIETAQHVPQRRTRLRVADALKQPVSVLFPPQGAA